MSLRGKVKAEFDRSPVATLSAPGGVLVGVAGIVVAWALAPPGLSQGVPAAASRSAGAAASLPAGSGALLVIGVFCALTPSVAGLAGILYKLNRFVAVPTSILMAALSIFLNRLNAEILGFGAVGATRASALDDLLFYGTVLIFLAVAGRRPLMDFARSDGAARRGEEIDASEAVGTFLLAVLLILIWAGLLGWAQRRMLEAFLP